MALTGESNVVFGLDPEKMWGLFFSKKDDSCKWLGFWRVVSSKWKQKSLCFYLNSLLSVRSFHRWARCAWRQTLAAKGLVGRFPELTNSETLRLLW